MYFMKFLKRAVKLKLKQEHRLKIQQVNEPALSANLHSSRLPMFRAICTITVYLAYFHLGQCFQIRIAPIITAPKIACTRLQVTAFRSVRVCFNFREL